MKYLAAIFDMDGTILNTLTDLQNAVNHALKLNHMPQRTYEEVRMFVGNGIAKLIERAVPEGTDAEAQKKVYEDFTAFYKIHSSDTTKPYDGVTKAIADLKKAGVKTAVVSNKADYGVQDLVKVFFNGLFDVAVGQKDGLNTKPHPDMINLALSSLNVSNKESVYIGDSDVDFNTAKNSNMDFIGVSWGFRGRSFLQNLGTKMIVDQADELMAMIVN